MTASKRLPNLISLVLSVLLLASIVSASVAQHLTTVPHRGVVQVPIGDDVYGFLRHMSVRGVITGYSEAELPLSEYEIGTMLRDADTTNLSNAERALRWKFMRTFMRDPETATTWFSSTDATPLFWDGLFSDRDKYLYRWVDDSTHSDLYAHLVASLEFRRRQSPEPGMVALTVGGGRFSGTLGGHVGYYLQATNGQDHGDSSVAMEDPSLGKNRNFAYFSRNNFDFTSAELSYNYDWFTAKLGRESIAIGGSYQYDNIILSPNTPYFDFVSLGAHVGAVRFESVVAALLADTVYFGVDASIPSKFLTLHDLTFDIGKNVEFGFTDMVIFSNRFELAYTNPFSFLKSVEASLNDRDNGLLGTHALWRIAPGLEVRGEGLVDDVLAERIGKGYWSNKFAWQLGGMWAGVLGMKDVDLTAEWTRVEPFTYSHFGASNTFSSTNTLLGSQIGPNSISYWGSLRWAPSEKLTLGMEAQLLKHGENIFDSTGKMIFNAGGDYRYTANDSTRALITTVLNGRQVSTLSLTFSAQYEPFRGITVFLRATHKGVSYGDDVVPDAGVVSGLWHSANPAQHSETLFALGARALF